MAYLVLLLGLVGGLILASTFVFHVGDAVVAVGWLAWPGSLALLIVGAVLAGRRAGLSRRASLRQGAHEAWQWLKTLTP